MNYQQALEHLKLHGDLIPLERFLNSPEGKGLRSKALRDYSRLRYNKRRKQIYLSR